MSKKGISIVLCCYNSEDRIRPTLTHLFNQILVESLSWEVILVDNNCTDNTLSIAKELHDSFTHIPFQIVAEKQPGLSYARMKGLKTTQYDYVLYCDDDNWLAPDYVQKAYEIMESDEEIGVLGGQGKVTSDSEIPSWFYTYQGSYACGVQAIHSGDISARGYVWGAGFVIRKVVLEKCLALDFQFFCSDRIGKELMSGGDSEICKWYLLANTKLWYDERLKYRHYMSQDRLTKPYLEKLFRGFKISNKYLNTYDAVLRDMQNPVKSKKTMAVKAFFDLCWATLFQPKKKYEVKHQIQRLYPNKENFSTNKVYQTIYQYYLKYHQS